MLKSLSSEMVATEVMYPFAINLFVNSVTKFVISVLPKSLSIYFPNIFSLSISFNKFSSSSKFIWDIWNLISFTEVFVAEISAFSSFNLLKSSSLFSNSFCNLSCSTLYSCFKIVLSSLLLKVSEKDKTFKTKKKNVTTFFITDLS